MLVLTRGNPTQDEDEEDLDQIVGGFVAGPTQFPFTVKLRNLHSAKKSFKTLQNFFTGISFRYFLNGATTVISALVLW